MKRSQNPWTHTVTVDEQRRCTSRIGPSGPNGKVWAPSVDALANSPEGALHKERVTVSLQGSESVVVSVWQNAPATPARRTRLPSDLLRSAFRLRALLLGRAHVLPWSRRSLALERACPARAASVRGGTRGTFEVHQHVHTQITRTGRCDVLPVLPLL